jgi:hypothetical protein
MDPEREIKASSSFDERVASYLESVGQKVSRRGLLAKAGRIILRISGIAVIPLLPLDRRFTASASPSCSWKTCGMCGAFCAACCGSPGGYYPHCPSCLNYGGGWGCCCYDTSLGSCNCVNGHRFLYVDCCAPNTTQGIAQAKACKSSVWCQTPPTGDCGGEGGCYAGGNYCVNGNVYSCTILLPESGTCDACNNGIQE